MELKQGTRSLRARKKLQQRAELLSAATVLFRDRGYEETRIEDIAVRADVSTKTVYNYFPTKQQILIDLLSEDRKSLVASYEKVVKNPPADLAEALARLIRADVGDVRTADEKKLWRELLAAETRAHVQAEDEFQSNRNMFMEYIERLLLHYKKAGKLSATLSIPVAVDVVYAINAHDFRQYCAEEKSSPADVLNWARQQMRHLVASWHPET
jgi:AcrR family transcriptional regulator